MFEDTRERHVETNLFLVTSCYYSSELCRWISSDDIEYLDPESLDGLNLYSFLLKKPYIKPDISLIERRKIPGSFLYQNLGVLKNIMKSSNNHFKCYTKYATIRSSIFLIF